MNKLTSMQCGKVTMFFMVVMLMDSGVGALLQGAQRGVEQNLSTGAIEDTPNAINLGETKNEQLPTATVVGETQIEQPHTPSAAQSHPTAAEFLSEHGNGQLDIASARKMGKKTEHAAANAKLTGNGCSGGGCGKAVSDEHDTPVNPGSVSIDTKIETALSVVTKMWTGVGIGEATAMGMNWTSFGVVVAAVAAVCLCCLCYHCCYWLYWSCLAARERWKVCVPQEHEPVAPPQQQQPQLEQQQQQQPCCQDQAAEMKLCCFFLCVCCVVAALCHGLYSLGAL